MTCDEPALKSTLPTAENGDITEHSPVQEQYAKLLSTYHGAQLIVDYGYARSAYGDSVQALYKHAPCAITEHFGEADLTSHIDFEWLATFYKNTKRTLNTQCDFLHNNGITIRVQQLNNIDVSKGYDRLTSPQQMGELFKVLEIFNPIP